MKLRKSSLLSISSSLSLTFAELKLAGPHLGKVVRRVKSKYADIISLLKCFERKFSVRGPEWRDGRNSAGSETDH